MKSLSRSRIEEFRGINMNKLELLQEELRNYGKVAIAYSGGVDSNFLFHVALETLGKENVLPVLCRGAMMSKEDIEDALEQLKDSNHVVLSVKACEELGIISPLANNDLTKQEIRDYSKQLGIATYNKPSNACLASRFDYNTELTLEKLKLVETGEKYLHDLGMLHVRLRVHGDVARLEVESQDFMKIIENKELIQNIKNLGFRFVTLDLEGIRSGGYDIENIRNSTKG